MLPKVLPFLGWGLAESLDQIRREGLHGDLPERCTVTVACGVAIAVAVAGLVVGA